MPSHHSSEQDFKVHKTPFSLGKVPHPMVERAALDVHKLAAWPWVHLQHWDQCKKLIRYYFLLKKLAQVVVDLLFMLLDFGKGPEYDPFWSQTGQTWHAGQNSRVGQKGSKRVNITDHLGHSDTSIPFEKKK